MLTPMTAYLLWMMFLKVAYFNIPRYIKARWRCHDTFTASIETVKNKLKTKMRANYPQVKVATVFYKSEKRVVDFEPDWYVEKSTTWIVFPHEVEEMSKEEIALHKGSEIAQYYKQ